MTVEQALEYDWRKVVHLEALGNEGHESSFEHIVSHVNSTISPVVKRAGIHALRNYNHSKVKCHYKPELRTKSNSERACP